MVTLGVDLDNTTVDYSGALWRWLCTTRGVTPGPAPQQGDYTDFSGYGLNGRDEFVAAHVAAVNDGLFTTVDEQPGATATLAALAAAGVRLRVVTARFFGEGTEHRAVIDTATWLAGDAATGRTAVPYSDLVFTDAKHEVDCDLWVDDSPSVITSLLDSGVAPSRVIVFDQPYNRHLPGVRAHTWADVARHVRHTSVRAA